MTDKLWLKKLRNTTGCSESVIQRNRDTGNIKLKDKYALWDNNGIVITSNTIASVKDILLEDECNYEMVRINDGKMFDYKYYRDVVIKQRR